METENENTNYRTAGQEIALMVCITTSGFLSIAGSGCIVFACRKWRSSMYHRIMAGLSVSDIVMSFYFLLTPYLRPAEDGYVGAIGNTKTCAFSGAMEMTGFAGACYNFSLAFYFDKTIRGNVRELDFSRRYEKWIHATPLAMVTSFIATGVALKAFNPSPMYSFCDVTPYPSGCQDDGDVSDCVRGQHAVAYGNFLALFYTFIGCAGVAVTLRVYCYVARQIGRDQSRSFANIQKQRERKRAVASQAALYSLAFINCFVWCAIMTLQENVLGLRAEDVGAPKWFYLSLMGHISNPLQGFLNFFIYVRPRYTRWRDAEPDRSQLWALRKVFRGEPAPTRRSGTSRSLRAARTGTSGRHRSLNRWFSFRPSPAENTVEPPCSAVMSMDPSPRQHAQEQPEEEEEEPEEQIEPSEQTYLLPTTLSTNPIANEVELAEAGTPNTSP